MVYVLAADEYHTEIKSPRYQVNPCGAVLTQGTFLLLPESAGSKTLKITSQAWSTGFLVFLWNDSNIQLEI